MESSVGNENLIDIECGESAMIDEEIARQFVSSNGQDQRALNRVWSGFVGIDGSVRGEGTVNCAHNNSKYSEIPITHGKIIEDKMFEAEECRITLEKKVDAEKPKKKSYRKPPKPPRPPKSPPMDAADQKLIRELSELAMLKRARIDRMKKKLKNTKSTTSNSNLCALTITIIFCLVIVWQGMLHP